MRNIQTWSIRPGKVEQAMNPAAVLRLVPAIFADNRRGKREVSDTQQLIVLNQWIDQRTGIGTFAA